MNKKSVLTITEVITMYADNHCHLHEYEDLLEVLLRAKAANVKYIIGVSMDISSFYKTTEIAKKYDNVIPAVGIHPWNASKCKQDVEKVRELLPEKGIMGEIGLDHHFVENKEEWDPQLTVFETLLRIAEEKEASVIIHSKGAESETLNILETFNIKNVILHWYQGPENLLPRIIDDGYFMSFTPALHYSPKLQNFVKRIDTSRILTESDGPVTYRKKRGEPANVVELVEKIAELKSQDKEETQKVIFNNFKEIFC
jgi:TatD DNase family protein